ncbi:RHS repeat-associated core domain-containing protein [Escherichia albertii]
MVLFSGNGECVWRKPERSLWGVKLWETGENPRDPGLLFAGQMVDRESGLAYNRFRYYSTETACYLTSDPIGLAGGLNLYSYVPNPLNWIDPLGLTSCQLSAAMEKNRTPRPANSAAHHIVPETAKGARPARDILNKHGIDINGPDNGVFLPNRNNTDGISGVLHNGKHPDDYISAINERIRNADKLGGKQEVINELGRINDILSGANRNSSWYTILL